MFYRVRSSNIQVDPLGGIPIIHSHGADLQNADTRSMTSERPPSTMNWMTGTTVHTMDRSGGTMSSRDPTPMPPPSVAGVGGPGGTGTLKNRSASRNAYHQQRMHGHHVGGADRLSKDFQKKRWLILALLSSEIEVTTTLHATE